MPDVTINIITPPDEPVDINVTEDPPVEIEIDPVGEKGDPGEGTVLTATAGEALSGGRVVYIDSGKAFYYDPSTAALAGKVVGLTKHAADADESIFITTAGKFYHSGLGLTPDQLYYIGPNGSLTTSVSGLLVIQKIGVAIDTNNIVINFTSPIITI